MKKALFRLLPLVALSLISSAALAQGDPDNGGPTPDPDSPTAVPIDGGASLLLAAGVGLGVRKLRRRSAAQ